MRLFVKICGITRPQDAIAAAEAGADAVGFVLWEGSPRSVTPERAAQLARALPDPVGRTGVFVDAPRARVESIARDVPLTAVQLHGEERREEFEGLPSEWYRAFRIDERSEVSSVAQAIVDLGRPICLLDTRCGSAPGGTGRPFDWRFAAKLSMHLALRGGVRLILAGGLTPENVPEAIRMVRPWGVDVSSGVESAPGSKDPARMRAFVEAARGAA